MAKMTYGDGGRRGTKGMGWNQGKGTMATGIMKEKKPAGMRTVGKGQPNPNIRGGKDY